MKTLIKDTRTNQYYCVAQTTPTGDGGLTAGPNDFPYWSEDIRKACVFDALIFAQTEMQFNDLTQDGERNPIIVDEQGNEIPNLYLIDRDGVYHMQSTEE